MDLNDLRLKAYTSAGAKTDGVKTVGTKKESSKASVTLHNSPVKSEKKEKYIPDPQVKAAAEALTSGGLLKVPAAEDGKEDVYRRVAKFLILIGVDQAALVMKHLTQEETEKIIPEITAVRTIDPDEALDILEEFNSVVERVKEGGGTHTAQTILEKAFGAERAKDLMDRLNIEEEVKPFSYLEDKESDRIFELLKEEANTVRALVLSYLKPEKAASVIKLLPAADKKEVIIQLAHAKKISPDVLKRVDNAIHEKSLRQIDIKTNAIDGKGVLAEILKKMDFSSEKEIISALAENDEKLAEDLQERLFTIDDVLNSDDRFIQEYLREYNDTDIAYLIGDKPEEFREKILGNVSQARASLILEEESFRKPMLKKDCNEITQKFFAHLRHAWEDGSLIIKGRDDEIYV